MIRVARSQTRQRLFSKLSNEVRATSLAFPTRFSRQSLHFQKLQPDQMSTPQSFISRPHQRLSSTSPFGWHPQRTFLGTKLWHRSCEVLSGSESDRVLPNPWVTSGERLGVPGILGNVRYISLRRVRSQIRSATSSALESPPPEENAFPRCVTAVRSAVALSL